TTYSIKVTLSINNILDYKRELCCSVATTMPRPRRPSAETLELRRTNTALVCQLACARDEIRKKESHLTGLEVLLNLRLKRIDKLTVQIEQLRMQNQNLDAECERLVEMVRLAPAIDAAMAPK